jgi:malonyl-CoA O-methyltransferase
MGSIYWPAAASFRTPCESLQRLSPALSDLVNIPPDVEHSVPGLDLLAAARWRTLTRNESPWLHEEVASRMVERLHWFRVKPASWLHWEPVLGGLRAHQSLREQFPDAACHIAASAVPEALEALQTAAPRSWNPLRWLRDAAPQPLKEKTEVDMLWANMVLHHDPYPQTLLRRWYRHIKTDGYLMFSCLGPDSLRELRAVYERLGWPSPSHSFTDMHDWGDMLVDSGFAEPVMDMERLTLTYSTAAALLNDLRDLGRNLSAGRFSGLRTRAWRRQLEAAIEEQLPRTEDGRLILTMELIYGHAFKAAPKRSQTGESTSTVSVDEMRSMLRSGRNNGSLQ